MKNFKSHFRFTKQERSGIFFLILVIIILQGVYFALKWNAVGSNESSFQVDKATQAHIDSLKLEASKKDSVKIFPFNPNFITDYKGYTLGMSPEEIDRLHSFRAKNQFMNSTEEFQVVTQVSDSLLNTIKPYFKFPEWVNRRNTNRKITATKTKEIPNKINDLNTATAEELKSINGIGEKLSARIVKFRDRLGGFLVNEQLYDVYGLETDVVNRTLKYFQVLSPPEIKKININSATIDELASLVYIRYDLAENIVDFRQLNGSFESFDELVSVQGFPKEKIARIQLYLSL